MNIFGYFRKKIFGEKKQEQSELEETVKETEVEKTKGVVDPKKIIKKKKQRLYEKSEEVKEELKELIYGYLDKYYDGSTLHFVVPYDIFKKDGALKAIESLALEYRGVGWTVKQLDWRNKEEWKKIEFTTLHFIERSKKNLMNLPKKHGEWYNDELSKIEDIRDDIITKKVAPSEKYFIGENAEGNGNELLKQYFETVPEDGLHKILREEKNKSAKKVIMDDWDSALKYCRENGMPDEAFVAEDVNSLKFTKAALDYVMKGRRSGIGMDFPSNFPGLDVSKLNDADYVNNWLSQAEIGFSFSPKYSLVDESKWITILTGYCPDDHYEDLKRYHRLIGHGSKLIDLDAEEKKEYFGNKELGGEKNE